MVRPSHPTRSLHRSRAIKLGLLGMIIAALMLPASSLAAGPTLSPVNPPQPFTISGGVIGISHSNGGGWTCEASSGSGTWSTGSSATGTLTFTGCRMSVFGQCTSPGQPTGTIKTSNLSITPVYLNKAQSKFGLLYTPVGTTVFTEYQCGVFIKHHWKGSLIGEITAPGMEGISNTHKIAFNGAFGKMQYTQVEEEGPVYQLVHGGTGEGGTTAIDTDQTMDFNLAFMRWTW